ncbi:uncharacterized protein [Rutidosis leptorrhynchoides]|uniref:uncharacterized protein n=1 Tax=Rutidosis leptorrhynchoides TaxID=125765 RepID=UPI003A9994AF
MCKAYRKYDFDHHYGILSRRIPDSTRTLTTIGLNKWSRHHADRVRYAYLTTISAESMNALSVHARKLPVTMLLEFFRASVQQWFWEHRNTAAGLTTPVTHMQSVNWVKEIFFALPCGHVMAVARYFVLHEVTTHVQKYFTTETYKSAYMEDINPLDHIFEWIDPGNLQTVRPPLVTK